MATQRTNGRRRARLDQAPESDVQAPPANPSLRTIGPSSPTLHPSEANSLPASFFKSPSSPSPARSSARTCSRQSPDTAKSAQHTPPPNHISEDTHGITVGGADHAGGRQVHPDTHHPQATAATVRQITFLHRQRMAAIKQQRRINSSCGSLVRTFLGWRFDLPKKERSAINAKAADLVSAIQAGESLQPEHAEIASKVAPFCVAAAQARASFDVVRKDFEKQLATLVRTLPIWNWAEATRGIAEGGLASLIGEAGDVDRYDGPAKLWFRFGVAPPHCYDRTLHNGRVANCKPKARRSVLWTIGAALIKAKGPYYELYLKRKEYEVQRNPEFDNGIDPKTGRRRGTKHCDLRAQRYMEKEFLKDLWRAWRAATNAPAAKAA